MSSDRWRRLAREESRLSGQRAVVAGVDEAGRGPLAGPVVAAAVVLDLSADWSGVASVASRTAIEIWHSEQTPGMKLDFIESLQAKGKKVLMIGDGVNDAPVLSMGKYFHDGFRRQRACQQYSGFHNNRYIIEIHRMYTACRRPDKVGHSAKPGMGAGLQSLCGSVCSRGYDRALDGCTGHVPEFFAGGVEFGSPGQKKIASNFTRPSRTCNAMSMLYVLIPLAVVLLAIAVFALLWVIKHGQFDDLETHGWSVVLDDNQNPPASIAA